MSLTKSELNKRMLELRNLRKLYEDQRSQNIKLRAENKELKLSVQVLTQTVTELLERVAKLELRNEELLVMTFGKKKVKVEMGTGTIFFGNGDRDNGNGDRDNIFEKSVF